MTDQEMLQAICNESTTLANSNVDSSSPEFKAWKTRADRFLIKKFGKNSYEYENFNEIKYSLGIWTFDTPDYRFIEACREGLMDAKAILETYLEEIAAETTTTHETARHKGDNYSKVFIVHGHNGELKERVARIIERQGLQAVILSEQANRGQTIIEKLEAESDAAGAVCLFTADDLGKTANDTDFSHRARQNVVFETGYFIGKLGRSNVIILANTDIEIPSDMQGVVYTSNSNWEYELLRELKAMGYVIDFNKIEL